jgi:hypothetical protein
MEKSDIESENDGIAIHDPDAIRRSEAARAMGAARTPAKAAASRANGLARKGTNLTDEQKERLRLARWGNRPPKEEKPKRAPGRTKQQAQRDGNEPTSGAIPVERIRALSGSYGEQSLDAPDLARKLRKEAEAGR